MNRWILSTAMLVTTLAPAQVAAQADTDAPGRGVARISLLNGDVSIRRGDSGDWVAAAVNAPALADDRVLTGPNSRAEVQLDYYHRIRLAGDTEIHIADLENQRYTLQVARGTVTFAALKGGDAQVELQTPGAAMRLMEHGSYRITVKPDGVTELTVRDGKAEIVSAQGTQTLNEGRTMMVRSTGANESEFQLISVLPKDSWDEFNRNRDRDLERRLSVYSNVSRDVYGAEDLYDNGDWTYVAPYGQVWRPRVSVGWAPYRNGRWSWLDYYGWSWVSYDPWGWAPYHYGRWFNYGGNWCWYPGAMSSRHWWRPGLVAWFGWGHGGIGIGVGWGGYGHFGWVPLAPFERYHPWYGRNRYDGYRNRTFGHNSVTVVNNYNIRNNYRNARINGGMSVVNGNDFTRGVAGRAIRGNEVEMTRASLLQGGVPATPGRDSLRFNDRAVRSDVAARGSGNETRFFGERVSARTERVPFEQQRQTMENFARGGQAEGRGRATEAVAGERGGTRGGDGAREVTRPEAGRSASPAQEGRGWRSAGEASGRTAEPATRQGETRSGEGDWRRFGDPRSGSGRGGEDAARGAASRTVETPRTGSESRGGWRSFGDPGRATGGRENAAETRGASSTGRGAGGEARVPDSGRTSGGDGSTGTGRGSANESRVERGTGGGSWSTGGGRSAEPAGRTGGRSEAPRVETPRSETPREAPRTGGEPGRTSGRTGRQDDSASWSTGSGFGRSSSDSWRGSTGGGSGSSRSAEPSYGGRSSGGFGGAARGGDFGGRSSGPAPSMGSGGSRGGSSGSSRSAEPSYGGRSSGGFGGAARGGDFGGRSSSPAPSMGSGGSRGGSSGSSGSMGSSRGSGPTGGSSRGGDSGGMRSGGRGGRQ